MLEEKRYFTPKQREGMCIWVRTANRRTVLTPVENTVVFDNNKLKEAHRYRTGCNPHQVCKGPLRNGMKKELCSFGVMLVESFLALEERLGISTPRPAKAPTPLALPCWRKGLLSSLTTPGRYCCALPADEQCGGYAHLWQAAVATEGLQICRRLCPGDRPQPSREPED